jgi:DHA3 family macrolide efflux protein-like MFS transporter
MSSAEIAVKPPGLFSNRFFQTILLSNILLQIGIWVRNFAILMYVIEKTNENSVAISLIYVAEFAPIFVFSFIGGTFADRWRPKRTMIWCDMLSSVSVFVVLLTLLIGTWQTVFFATFVSAILSQFSQPSAMRLFKHHIPKEQLQQSMAIFQSLIAIFMVAGPSLGVFAYAHFGIVKSISVMGVVFILSGLVLFRLPKDEIVDRKDAGETRFLEEVAEGFRYVWRSPVLKVLGVTFALVGLAVGIAQGLGIFIVTERLGKPKEYLQFLLMINGIAMLIGGASVAFFAKRVSPQKLLAVGLLVGAICTVVIGYSTSVPLTLVFQFVNGLMFPAIQVAISTMILQWSEEHVVGRVNGVLTPMFVGMMTLMMLVAGFLKTSVPLVTIYSAAGALMFLGMLVLVPIFKYKAPEGTDQASGGTAGH